jgi:ketosteroid isomerase-like protein
MATETGQVLDLARAADTLAIQDVLAKHSRGVDRADEAMLKSAYWPDATVEYGSFDGLAHQFCEMLPAGIKRYARTQHSISNVAIEIDGDDARVATYVTAGHYLEVDGDQGTEMTYFGRYLDRMQKRDNVWKITHRQVVMSWNQNADTTAEWEGPTFSGLARGARHPDDPLYALFGD